MTGDPARWHDTHAEAVDQLLAFIAEHNDWHSSNYRHRADEIARAEQRVAEIEAEIATIESETTDAS